MDKKVLLHACCAVCASYSILKLIEDGYRPIIYFYNPNIYPKAEYDRRLEELVNYCEEKKVELISGEYDFENYLKQIKGLEDETEKGKRCDVCFELRLNKTAKLAKELNIKAFCTTLTISPHKVSKNVFSAGSMAAKAHEIEFLPYDFKKQDGFKKAQQIAREFSMYKQTYCGCKFSIR